MIVQGMFPRPRHYVERAGNRTRFNFLQVVYKIRNTEMFKINLYYFHPWKKYIYMYLGRVGNNDDNQTNKFEIWFLKAFEYLTSGVVPTSTSLYFVKSQFVNLVCLSSN